MISAASGESAGVIVILPSLRPPHLGPSDTSTAFASSSIVRDSREDALVSGARRDSYETRVMWLTVPANWVPRP